MSGIEVGDDLLTGSETADRPNGETDSKLIEAHSSVRLGSSASPSTQSRGVSIFGIDLPLCALPCTVGNPMPPRSATSNTLPGLVAYSDDSQSDAEDSVASTSKPVGIGLVNNHVRVSLPGFVQSFPSLLAVFLFGNRISH